MNATLIAASGAPGTGRNITAVNKLLDLEAAHPDKTVCFLHDPEWDCPYPLGWDATPETMLWLFTARIQEELTLMKRGQYVVADQTIVDVIAHTIAAGFDGLAHSMFSIAESYISVYSLIIFRKIAVNECHRPDSLPETAERRRRQQIEDTLESLYDRLFMGSDQESKQLVFA